MIVYPSRIVMDKVLKSLVKNHTAFVYEDVRQEQMWELNADNAWPLHFFKNRPALGFQG